MKSLRSAGAVQQQRNSDEQLVGGKNNCYMDVRAGRKRLGRLVFELDDDRAPKTSHNFRMLCTGEQGFSKQTRKALHYRGHPFHRLIPGFMIQGGDITHGNGTGGESIYGKTFKDEFLGGRHNSRGVLSMANSGPNTNGSQFFVSFGRASHLDGKHVVFGKLVEGMDVLNKLEAISTNSDDQPRVDVIVDDCGVIENKEDLTKGESRQSVDATEREEQNEIQEKPDFSKMTAREKRLFELKMKMNEARKLNRKEVLLEQRRMNETPAQRKQRENREYNDIKKKRSEVEKEQSERNDPDKWILHDTAEKVVHRQRKMEKKQVAASIGLVNPDDVLYRTHKKKSVNVSTEVKATQPKPGVSNDVTYGGAVEDAPEDVDSMVNELMETEKRRKHYRRRRQYYEEETVSYINERNRKFNKKVNRFFDEYTAEIKANLEKGTA